MTTHPCGALSRVAIGSVADELIRRSHVPVVLVRPGKTAIGVFSEPIVDNVLIPLDGSTLAEQVGLWLNPFTTAGLFFSGVSRTVGLTVGWRPRVMKGGLGHGGREC